MMLTGKKTTYVLMERGVEDVALLKEIKALERLVGMGSGPVLNSRDFSARFPHLTALRQGLENEIDANEAA